MKPTDNPETSVPTSQRCVTSQKSEDKHYLGCHDDAPTYSTEIQVDNDQLLPRLRHPADPYAVRSAETSLSNYDPTRCQSPEDCNMINVRHSKPRTRK